MDRDNRRVGGIMAKIRFKVEGMRELEKSLKKLGKVPQKHVTASARKGMNIVVKQARADAPVDSGLLKKGIKLEGEKSRLKGKKVYRGVFDEKYNDFFQKPVKNPSKGSRSIAYYPFSQEYGYFLRDGRYMPGLRFMKSGLTDNVSKIAKTIVTEMKKKIDAEIAKGGLK